MVLLCIDYFLICEGERKRGGHCSVKGRSGLSVAALGVRKLPTNVKNHTGPARMTCKKKNNREIKRQIHLHTTLQEGATLTNFVRKSDKAHIKHRPTTLYTSMTQTEET